MRTQLLIGTGNRSLGWLLVCCLFALAVPAAAKAANFDDAVCAVQSVNNPPLPPTWQIRGTGKVKNIPAGYTAVTVKVTFQMRVNAAGAWGNLFDVDQTVGVTNGTANIDTGFQSMGAPAKGNQYRIFLNGSVVAVPPNLPAIPLVGIGSTEITPVP
jgi:hypothetical protein